MNEWISVDDRLPEHKTPVVVHSEKCGVLDGSLRDDGRDFWRHVWQCGAHLVSDVTHWMPRHYPDPPEPEPQKHCRDCASWGGDMSVHFQEWGKCARKEGMLLHGDAVCLFQRDGEPQAKIDGPFSACPFECEGQYIIMFQKSACLPFSFPNERNIQKMCDWFNKLWNEKIS